MMSLTITDLEVGVLLTSAVLSRGTRMFVSGKEAAQQPRAVGYATARNPRARRSPGRAAARRPWRP